MSNGIVQFAGGTFPSDATCKFKNRPKAPKISFLDLNKTCIRFSIEYGQNSYGQFPENANLAISLFASSSKIQFPGKITLHFYYINGTKEKYDFFRTNSNVFQYSKDLGETVYLIRKIVDAYSVDKDNVLLAITNDGVVPNFVQFYQIK
ncbi:hypothetical protein C4N15_07615 [Fusobacterium necrophorum subsp. funduliforme]|uniref:hypothetical protein n=1 Tax=Fusobacterium necrophorum TaxID=859 RepID=UPI000245D948|nr:hypothetical protein [Fusobacterium necrophorum]AVQ21525.1 hypothetical protein C4N15_07615 [Fusobacterium necrophorum subsp. funduliforme]EHO19516.1 hypothetical protein HMPREF9466_01447 [Fusobacterium necrophorum subsp. funduliforme 1_1_36S]